MTKEKLRKVIGERIKRERMTRDMSIDEMAKALGLTPGYLGLIERGLRGATAFTLYNVSILLGVSADDILYERETIKDVRVNEVQRQRLYSLTYGLKYKEIVYLIDQVKGLRELRE